MSSTRIERKRNNSHHGQVSKNNNSTNFEKNIKDDFNSVMKNISNSKNRQKNHLIYCKNEKLKKIENTITAISPSSLPSNDNPRLRSYKKVLEKFEGFSITKKTTSRKNTTSKPFYYKKSKIVEDNENLPCTNDLCLKFRQLAQLNAETKRIKTKVSEILPSERPKEKNRELRVKQITISNQYLKKSSKSTLDKQKENRNQEINKKITNNTCVTKDLDVSSSMDSLKYNTPKNSFPLISNQYNKDNCECFYDCCHDLEAKFSSTTSGLYCDLLSPTDYTSYNDGENESTTQSSLQLIQKTSSANMLIHFRELLNQYDLEKISNKGTVALLSEDDVNLLRKLIKTDERYSYLKRKDRRLLKEMLLVQQCELQAKERIIEQALRNLRRNLKNKSSTNLMSSVREFNQGIKQIPFLLPKKGFSSSDSCIINKNIEMIKNPLQKFILNMEKLDEIAETNSLSSLKKFDLVDKENKMNTNEFKCDSKTSNSIPKESSHRSTSTLEQAEKQDKSNENLTKNKEIILTEDDIVKGQSFSAHSFIPYPSLTEIDTESGSKNKSVPFTTSPLPPISTLDKNLNSPSPRNESPNKEHSKSIVEVIFESIPKPEKEAEILKSISARLEKSVERENALQQKQRLHITRSLDMNFPVYPSCFRKQSHQSVGTDELKLNVANNTNDIKYSPINIEKFLHKFENMPKKSNVNFETIKMKLFLSVETYITYSVQCIYFSITFYQYQVYKIHFLSVDMLKYVGNIFVKANSDPYNFELKRTNFDELKSNPDQLFTILKPIRHECVTVIPLDPEYSYETKNRYESINPWKSHSPYNVPAKGESQLKMIALSIIKSWKKNMNPRLKELNDLQLVKLINKNIKKNQKNKKIIQKSTHRKKNIEKEIEKWNYRKNLLKKAIQAAPLILTMLSFMLPDIKCDSFM